MSQRREEEADHTGVTKQQQQQERRNESSAPNKYPVTTPQTVVNFVRGAHRRLQLTAGTQDGPPRRDVSSRKLASSNCRLSRVPRPRAVRCNPCAHRRPPLRSTSFPGSAFCDNVLTPTSPPCRQQPLGNPAVVLIHGRGTHFYLFSFL